MAMSLVIPLLMIVGYLIFKASPSLSWSFLVDVPIRGMREGGIWPAFIGTLYW